jgi:hypothetical protein
MEAFEGFDAKCRGCGRGDSGTLSREEIRPGGSDDGSPTGQRASRSDNDRNQLCDLSGRAREYHQAVAIVIRTSSPS